LAPYGGQVTEIPDADLAEQNALVDLGDEEPDPPNLGSDAAVPPVDEGDAVEQSIPVPLDEDDE
jgi:hypothetical protein